MNATLKSLVRGFAAGFWEQSRKPAFSASLCWAEALPPFCQQPSVVLGFLFPSLGFFRNRYLPLLTADV